MIFTDNYSGLFLTAIVLLLTGAAASLAFRRGRMGSIASFVPAFGASVLLIAFSVMVITSQSKLQTSDAFWSSIPELSIDLYVDGMSAFFLLILGLVTLAVSIYSIGYRSHYNRDSRSLGFLFNLFVLSMVIVIASNSVFSFLIFWELMSLSSFFLVIYEHEEELNIRSGMMYLIMTHIGTAFILASFLALFVQTGSLSFDSFRNHALPMPHYIRDIAFILAFIGFGAKAGLVPLHIWLPKAHPSAPSNISALMSAVMVKVAIYGLVRTTFDFAAPSTAEDVWWGVTLIIAGSASSIIGILYAAVENDIKRALAYSTIENVGVIVLGIGISAVFQSFNLTSLAAFALLASMYHSLNHATFKSLLFMGAGSVVFSTHTKNIEKLGGLIKKMPWTALLFLIGAIAISGLPPLNGFVSEWLLLQSFLSSYHIPSLALQVLISLAGVVIALTIGLTLATFVKIFGITFLARPRSEAAKSSHEVPRTMLAGMAMTAAMCVILGIMPVIATSLISNSFRLDSNQLPQTLSPFAALAAPAGASSNMSPGSLALMLGCVGAFAIGVFSIGGRKTTRRIYSTWDCGFEGLNERMQYTASALSQPIRVIFRTLYKPYSDSEVSYFSESNHYLKKNARVEVYTRDLFDELFYRPVTRATIAVLDAVRKMQTGKINAYLMYIMIALIALLVYAGVSR